jgi:oxalate decarboxylase
VWYFPRGFGHSIQGIGSEDCLFVLVFDNGYFSEFGTFSISDWVGPHAARGAGEELRCAGVDLREFSRNARSISPRDRCRRRFPPIPRPERSIPERSPIAIACWRSVPTLIQGGTNRLVSQREFPISTTITGALMRIKPGGMRELHWHPNADEWQYYIGGRARMSVFGSHGRVRLEEFNAGDVGYVPQGYGHYIENAGSEDLELLIVLNNGTYESISLANWMGANPPLLLATNFEVPESTFKDFLTRDRFMPG